MRANINADSYARGMKDLSDFFARQRAEAEEVLTATVTILNRKHQKKFQDYVQVYGEDFGEDVMEAYQSLVIVQGCSTPEQFIDWVEDRFCNGDRLLEPRLR